MELLKPHSISGSSFLFRDRDFQKAEELRAVADYVPADKILIETDCPFLAPVPHREKRNEPAFVVEVARCIAELKKVAVEDLGQITAANFARLFSIVPDSLV